MLVVTQVLSMLQSLALARARVQPASSPSAWILVLQVVQGVINAFDTPARQAFVVEMVEDRADLPNAIALNSSMVNAQPHHRPVASAASLIAAVGEGWCFLVDAVSYLAVIASLLAMTVQRARSTARARRRASSRSCADGFRYVSRFLPVRSALTAARARQHCIGMPYTVLMPVIATNVLHGGAHTLGFLDDRVRRRRARRRALPRRRGARCSGSAA